MGRFPGESHQWVRTSITRKEKRELFDLAQEARPLLEKLRELSDQADAYHAERLNDWQLGLKGQLHMDWVRDLCHAHDTLENAIVSVEELPLAPPSNGRRRAA